MAKRYHRKHLNQAIAAACLAVTAIPAAIAPPAWAVTTTINSSTAAGPVALGAGENLVVTSSGTISGGSQGVRAIGVTAGDITNSGTIIGGSPGIIISSSGIVGAITNSGSISGGTLGITVFGSSSVTGAIENSGTISGGPTGIWVATSSIDGGIENSGTISGGGKE